MPWYRCELEDANREVTITLDVLANAEGVADRALIFYGYYRDNRQADNWPMAVTYDGNVDWGSASSFVSTLPIHGAKITRGAVIRYVDYKTKTLMEQGISNWTADLVIKRYRDHAED